MVSSNERKAYIQRDIASLLESSLQMSKNKESAQKRKRIKESIYRSSSLETMNKFKIKGIQTERVTPSLDRKKDTLSKNELMLLEKILEKDDEIKQLRIRLDKFQVTPNVNLSNTCKIYLINF